MRILAFLVSAAIAIVQSYDPSYPRPYLAIYPSSPTLKLYTNQDIIFDVSNSFLPNASASYYFYFQFGELNAQKTGPAYSILGPLNYSQVASLKVSHGYEKPGFKTVNVTVSDRPFIPKSQVIPPLLQDNNDWKDFYFQAATSSNLVAPIASLTIYIHDGKPDCAQWTRETVFIDENNIEIRLMASGPSAFDPVESKQLSRAFQSMGEFPTVTLRNITAVYKLNITASDDGYWSAIVPRSLLESDSELLLDIKSNNVMLAGCRVMSQQLVLHSMDPARKSFGFHLNRNGSNIASFTSFSYNQHVCLGSQVVATFDSSNSSGAIILFSLDGMDSMQYLLDLARNPDGKMTLASDTICVGLTAGKCSSLKIYSSLSVEDYIFFLTSEGIVSLHLDPNGVSFSPLPLASALGQYSNIPDFWKKSMLSVQSSCYLNEPVIFSFIHGTSAVDDAMNGILIFTLEGFLEGQPQLKLTMEDIVVNGPSSPSLSFISMIQHHNINAILYLVGQKRNVTSNGVPKYGNVALYSQSFGEQPFRRVGQYKSWPTFNLQFSFDHNFEATGMKFHQNWLDLVVYGNAIYQSSGFGVRFTALKTRVSSIHEDECVTSFLSVQNSPKYAMVTSSNRILYGSIIGGELFDLVSMPPSATQQKFSQICMDSAVGRLSSLQLEILRGNNLSSSSEQLLVRKYPIAVDSLLMSIDMAAGLDVVLKPGFQSRSKMALSVHDSTAMMSPIKVITLGMEGSRLMRSDEIAICEILPTSSDVSSYTDCFMRSRVVEENNSESPAIERDVQVLNLEAGSNSTILRLDSDGWLFSDVGKTVVIKYNSFLILAIVNGKEARVQAPPTTILDATNNSLAAEAGTWKIYDFRSFREEAKVWKQTLNVTSTGSVDAMAVVAEISSDGDMEFTSYHDGMVITFGTEYGIVVGRISSHKILIRSFTSAGITAKTFGAGEWSLFRTNSDYKYGTWPISSAVKVKSWSLRPKPCLIKSFRDSFDSNGVFMERGVSIKLNVLLSLAEEQLTSPSKGLFASLERIALLNAQSQSSMTFDGSLLTLNASVLVQEGGERGRSSITFKSNSYTLMCPIDVPIYQIFIQCNPVSKIVIDKSNIAGLAAVKYYTLPENYRPPSSLGVNIPTSRNIYNANPKASRYNDYFSVSKESGEFKMCQGKESGGEGEPSCGCTDSMRDSQLEMNSDCIKKVPLTHFSSHVIPNIKLYVGNNVFSKGYKYKLVELNNRTDYCATDIDNCDDVEMIRSHVYDSQSGIIWKGSQLFHFRLELVDGSFCALDEEFLIYVEQPPLSVNISELSLAGTTALFGVFMFYCIHCKCYI